MFHSSLLKRNSEKGRLVETVELSSDIPFDFRPNFSFDSIATYEDLLGSLLQFSEANRSVNQDVIAKYQTLHAESRKLMRLIWDYVKRLVADEKLLTTTVVALGKEKALLANLGLHVMQPYNKALENISEQYECEDHLEVVIYFHRILNVFSSAERSFRTTMVEVGWINLLLKEMVIFLKRYNMKMGLHEQIYMLIMIINSCSKENANLILQLYPGNLSLLVNTIARFTDSQFAVPAIQHACRQILYNFSFYLKEYDPDIIFNEVKLSHHLDAFIEACRSKEYNLVFRVLNLMVVLPAGDFLCSLQKIVTALAKNCSFNYKIAPFQKVAKGDVKKLKDAPLPNHAGEHKEPAATVLHESNHQECNYETPFMDNDLLTDQDTSSKVKQDTANPTFLNENSSPLATSKVQSTWDVLTSQKCLESVLEVLQSSDQETVDTGLLFVLSIMQSDLYSPAIFPNEEPIFGQLIEKARIQAQKENRLAKAVVFKFELWEASNPPGVPEMLQYATTCHAFGLYEECAAVCEYLETVGIAEKNITRKIRVLLANAYCSLYKREYCLDTPDYQKDEVVPNETKKKRDKLALTASQKIGTLINEFQTFESPCSSSLILNKEEISPVISADPFKLSEADILVFDFTRSIAVRSPYLIADLSKEAKSYCLLCHTMVTHADRKAKKKDERKDTKRSDCHPNLPASESKGPNTETQKGDVDHPSSSSPTDLPLLDTPKEWIEDLQTKGKADTESEQTAISISMSRETITNKGKKVENLGFSEGELDIPVPESSAIPEQAKIHPGRIQATRIVNSHFVPDTILSHFSRAIHSQPQSDAAEPKSQSKKRTSKAPKVPVLLQSAHLAKYGTPLDHTKAVFRMFCDHCDNAILSADENQFTNNFFCKIYDTKDLKSPMSEKTISYGPWLYRFAAGFLFRSLALDWSPEVCLSDTDIHNFYLHCRRILLPQHFTRPLNTPEPQILLFVSSIDQSNSLSSLSLFSKGFSNVPLYSNEEACIYQKASFFVASIGILHFVLNFELSESIPKGYFSKLLPYIIKNEENCIYAVPANESRSAILPKPLRVHLAQKLRHVERMYAKLTAKQLPKSSASYTPDLKERSVFLPTRPLKGGEQLNLLSIDASETMQVLNFLPKEYTPDFHYGDMKLPPRHVILIHGSSYFNPQDTGSGDVQGKAIFFLVTHQNAIYQGVTAGKCNPENEHITAMQPYIICTYYLEKAIFLFAFYVLPVTYTPGEFLTPEEGEPVFMKSIISNLGVLELFSKGYLKRLLREKGFWSFESLLLHYQLPNRAPLDAVCTPKRCWYCAYRCQFCMDPAPGGAIHEYESHPLRFCGKTTCLEFLDTKPHTRATIEDARKQTSKISHQSNELKLLMQVSRCGLHSGQRAQVVLSVLYNTERLSDEVLIAYHDRRLLKQMAVEFMLSFDMINLQPMSYTSPEHEGELAQLWNAYIIQPMIASSTVMLCGNPELELFVNQFVPERQANSMRLLGPEVLKLLEHLSQAKAEANPPKGSSDSSQILDPSSLSDPGASCSTKAAKLAENEALSVTHVATSQDLGSEHTDVGQNKSTKLCDSEATSRSLLETPSKYIESSKQTDLDDENDCNMQ